MVMTWALAESSGAAHVEFPSAREANAALRAFGAAARSTLNPNPCALNHKPP